MKALSGSLAGQTIATSSFGKIVAINSSHMKVTSKINICCDTITINQSGNQIYLVTTFLQLDSLVDLTHLIYFKYVGSNLTVEILNGRTAVRPVALL